MHGYKLLSELDNSSASAMTVDKRIFFFGDLIVCKKKIFYNVKVRIEVKFLCFLFRTGIATNKFKISVNRVVSTVALAYGVFF